MSTGPGSDPGPVLTASADGGYEVLLEAGTLSPGADETLVFRVSRGGRPVGDL